MKAITFASLTALALAGAACSETSPAQPAETTETVTKIADTTPADDGFNLQIPGDTSGAAPSDGFNLGVPDSGAVSADGFNLPSDISTGSGLDDIPEIDTSILETEVPDTSAADDEIIRLDP